MFTTIVGFCDSVIHYISRNFKKKEFATKLQPCMLYLSKVCIVTTQGCVDNVQVYTCTKYTYPWIEV